MKRTIKTTEEEFDESGNLVKRVVVEEVEEDEPKADKPYNPYPNSLRPPIYPGTITFNNGSTGYTSASSGSFKDKMGVEDKEETTGVKPDAPLDAAIDGINRWLRKNYDGLDKR